MINHLTIDNKINFIADMKNYLLNNGFERIYSSEDSNIEYFANSGRSIKFIKDVFDFNDTQLTRQINDGILRITNELRIAEDELIRNISEDYHILNFICKLNDIFLDFNAEILSDSKMSIRVGLAQFDNPLVLDALTFNKLINNLNDKISNRAY